MTYADKRTVVTKDDNTKEQNWRLAVRLLEEHLTRRASA